MQVGKKQLIDNNSWVLDIIHGELYHYADERGVSVTYIPKMHGLKRMEEHYREKERQLEQKFFREQAKVWALEEALSDLKMKIGDEEKETL